MAEDEEIEAPSLDPETTCSICYAEFLDAEDLVIHIQQVHWSDSCRSCHFCPSVYRCLDDYALHIKNNHLLSLKACKHCQRIYDDFDILRKHEKLHTNQQRGKKLFCSHCVKTFDYKQDLADHEFNNHNDAQDGVFLNEIFPLLTGQLNITAFTFIMSLRETAAYICPCCMFTVNDPKDYINHTKKKKCQTIVCSKCCNVYRDKKGLIRHLQAHKECLLDTKKQDLIKKCKKCDKNISVKRYNEHLKICKPIKCQVCNLVMASMYALSQHQSENHPMTIQMKTCQFCHKEFVGSVALQRHFNRKHIKEVHLYKYKCVHCDDMYFKHPQNLFGHYFSKHHDIEPYCCKICNKKFKLRKKFTIHIKLEHNSVGFVEFDENYNVFFTEKKSDNPFTPTCLFPELIPDKTQMVDQTDNEQDDAPTDIQTDAPTDVPTDCQTDAQTDAEETKPRTQRKPPKIRYKEEKSKRNQAEFQSDTNMSEAQTDKENGNVETKSKLKRTRSQKVRERTIKKQVFHEDKQETDSDDEPLVKIKRKSMSNSSWKSKANMSKKDRLTCNICKKYCYTLLNYNYHMSLHFKNEVKKCVKCSEEFSSKSDLQEHMAEKHSSSRLTETLRNLLERRKQAKNGTLPELTIAEKFKKTIKQVKSGTPNACAVIKEVNEDLSVKKFIEEFTPEETNKKLEETNKAEEKKDVDINTNVSVSWVNYRQKKPPAIKMVKFKPERKPRAVSKLALPVRFKEVPSEKPHITCRVVHQTETSNYEEEIEYYDQGDDNVNNYEECEEQSSEPKMIVPEMAEEVLLETQEPPPKTITIPHNIVIPQMPQSLKNEIQIAHLLPEAPYYKIVKMSDVIRDSEAQEEISEVKNERDEDVELPAGTKLVNVNPLAHLLGNTTVEQIFGPKQTPKKSRKPIKKTPNFQQAIAKALAKLEKPDPCFKRKKTNKKKNQDDNAAVDVEQ